MKLSGFPSALRHISIFSAPALIACALVLMQGCTKEKMTELQSQVKQRGDKLYHFSVDVNQTKAVIANMETGVLSTDTWDGSDVIRVYNGVTYVDFRYDESNQYFYNANGIGWDNSCGYVMVYPASIGAEEEVKCTDGKTLVIPITLPDEQEFISEKQVKNMPMIAKADPLTWNDEIHFKHLCGVLKVSVGGASCKGSFKNIELEAGKCCGAGSITYVAGSDTFTPKLTMGPGAGNKITMVTNAATDGRHDFYIYLPEGTYTKPSLTVNFSNDAEASITHSTNSDVKIYRAKLTAATDYFQTLYSGGGINGSDVGTSLEKPYLIKTAQDIIDLAYNINNTTKALYGKSWHTGYYKLSNDINMGGVTLSPIGKNDVADHQFLGCFDGGGFTISNYVIDNSSDNAGLFGYVGTGAEIKNLNVHTVSCTGTAAGSNIGAIVGYLNGGTLTNCMVNKGRVVGSDSKNVTISGKDNVGGVVGYCNGGKLLNTLEGEDVDNSSFVRETEVNASGSNAGIVVGHTSGICKIERYVTFSGTSVTANATGDSRAGGIVGLAEGTITITKCVNDGNVTAVGSAAGGIIGSAKNGSCTIKADNNKWNMLSGEITIQAGKYAGGVIGYAEGSGSITSGDTGTFAWISSRLTIQATGNYVGGIIGYNDGFTLTGKSGTTTVGACNISGGSYVGGSYVSGGYYVGGIVGYNKSGNISYCTSLATVSGAFYVGGIVGIAKNSPTTAVTLNVTGCRVYGTITGTGNHVGGILGGSEYNSNFTVNIGIGTGTGTRNYNHATIKGEQCVGGIVGSAAGNTTIANGYTSYSIISGTNNVGGILGGANTAETSEYGSGTITVNRCYYRGSDSSAGADADAVASKTTSTVTASSNNAGGIVGGIGEDGSKQTSLTINACFVQNTPTVSGLYQVGLVLGKFYDYHSPVGINLKITNSGVGSGYLKTTGQYLNGSTPYALCGGLVGRVYMKNGTVKIINNFAYPNQITVKADSDQGIGGIIGFYDGSVASKFYLEGCISDLTRNYVKYGSGTAFTGTTQIGAIAGRVINDTGHHTTIKYCYYINNLSRIGQGDSVVPSGETTIKTFSNLNSDGQTIIDFYNSHIDNYKEGETLSNWETKSTGDNTPYLP